MQKQPLLSLLLVLMVLGVGALTILAFRKEGAGLFGVFIGNILLAPYLLYLLNKEQGALESVLVGDRRGLLIEISFR